MTGDMVRQWHVVVHDSSGESWLITDRYMIGTFTGLQAEVEKAVDQWEASTGMVAERIELESHGRVQP
jgi:hypothetical protein